MVLLHLLSELLEDTSVVAQLLEQHALATLLRQLVQHVLPKAVTREKLP